MKRRKMNRTAQSQTIFRKILRPLTVLAALNAVIFLLIICSSGVLAQMNRNRFDVFRMQVDNRRSYLQSQMTGKWMQLDKLAEYINSRTEQLLDSGELDLETLDSSGSVSAVLILDVVGQMISELYSRQVSGIYMVLNTHDFRQDVLSGEYHDKTGIYIRDNDPRSVASNQYVDLLLECSPVAVVREMSLSTDREWTPMFRFSAEKPYGDWLTEPYNTAVSGAYSAEYCGYWSVHDDDEGNRALSYTIPLILSDGTVYGVLGVEVLSSYLSTQLPNAELGGSAVYCLLTAEEVSDDGMPSTGMLRIVSGKNTAFEQEESLELSPADYGGAAVIHDGIRYACETAQLSIYSRNAPFESQRWYVAALVPQSVLFSFTAYVQGLLVVTAVLILLFGFAAVLFASWAIARPIRALRQELESESRMPSLKLSATGITEVDDFARTIDRLSQDVVNSSTRFLSIMKMSSIDMGGYEIDTDSGFAFVTENFFGLFGLDDLSASGMTAELFLRRMDRVCAFCAVEPADDGSILYTVTSAEGTRYIQVKETLNGSRRIGIAEDVTREIQDRKRIERERDYDLLTGIYNRRAFYRNAEKLMEDPQRIGIAVVLMIDLDNLKAINDTYGHEWGDNYIRAGARCLREHVPTCSVVARVSGDEFNALIYGFEDRQKARAAVEQLRCSFRDTCFVLPDGNECCISASGGVAFVDEEPGDLRQLIRYADFAMYLVKHSRKGFFGEFDREKYYATEREQKKRNAFKRVLREQRIFYAFQPIVDARTGELYACEALMRVKDDLIADVGELLRIARQENAMDEIEHMTWHHALTDFRALIETGTVGRDVRVFINSQISHILPPEEQRVLIGEYGDIRKNTVMEIVETDDASEAFADLRSGRTEIFAGSIALDDYGSGYNSERNLMDLMPRYVKLDMSLVRDLDKHSDRSSLIRGIISFAHSYNMLVLGEGVETMAELQCLLDMDVDLIQGYLMARPAAIPGPIAAEPVALIRAHAAKHG